MGLKAGLWAYSDMAEKIPHWGKSSVGSTLRLQGNGAEFTAYIYRADIPY